MTNQAKQIPSAVKNQALVRERRDQIIRGAVKLFIHKGFHKTTTREIAQACGLSVGAMYEYIQSKEDVLYLVCDYIHSELESRLRRVIVEEDSGKESMKKAVNQLFRVMGEMNDDVLLIYQETKSLPSETMKYVLQKEEEITALFERILEKGLRDGTIHIDPSSIKLMAHNIMVLGQMWTFRRWALHRYYSLEEFARRQTSLLLNELIRDGGGEENDEKAL